MVPTSPPERASLPDGGATFRLRGERWGPAGLLGVFLLMALLYLRVVPPLEGFDAVAHFQAVLHLRATGRLPALDTSTLHASYELIAQPPLYHALAGLAAAPWPVEPALALVTASPNPYFGGLSQRQTVALPNVPWGARAPLTAARLVSLLGALLAVVASWVLARTVVPNSWSFALAVTSVVAFNPVFLFLAVSVTNNGWSAGAVALTVALACRAALQDKPPRAWFWAGAAGGLALLAKYSGFLAGAPSLVMLGLVAQRQGIRSALTAIGWAALGGVLVAGGFYGRNLWLYGELVPLQRMAELIATLNRPEPWAWGVVWRYVPWLVWSYWGIFVAVIAPPAFLETVRLLMLVGFAGLLPALLRRDGATYAAKGWTLVMAAVWSLVVAAAVLHWTRTVMYGEQGRLANIAAPALALLWVIGWQAWLPLRWRPALHGGLSLVMVGLALWGAQVLHTAFRLPPALDAVTPDRPLDAHFAGGPALVGVDFPNGAALAPGRPLALTLYWTTPQELDEDYTLFLHLADDANRLLYQFDGVPGQGRHPTRQWRPGEIFADSYTIAVDPMGLPLQDGPATLTVGMYPFEETTRRLAVSDGQGVPIGDRVILAQVRLHAQAPEPGRVVTPLAQWQGGIGLAEAVVQQNAAGEPAAVALLWQSDAVQQQDFTRFVQVLDAQNQVLAQMDGSPQAGGWPTSTWVTGDRIAETVVLAPAALTSTVDMELAEWQRVVVGWYDAQGVRLPLTQPAAGQDFVTVMTRAD